MMTDKIPSFKEQIDTIHVPVDKLDTIILKTVQEVKPKRKRSLRKKLVYSASAVVAAFGLLIGSATVSPTMAAVAAKIPLIGSIFNESDDRGLVQVNKSGLTQVVGESKTVEGTTLTIGEIYYDGTRLTFGYSVESKEPLGERYITSMGFTVDGELFMGSMGGDDEKVVTPTYRTGIMDIKAYETKYFSDMTDLPEAFVLGLRFEGKDDKEWEFSIPVKKQSNATFIALDHTQERRGIELSVLGLNHGPGGLLLTYRTATKVLDPLRVMDHLEFKVVDSLGNELAVRGGGADGYDRLMNGSYLFDPIDSDATEVTITPYIEFPKQGEWGMNDWEGNIIEVDMTPYQGKEFEFDSFTVKLP